MKRKTWLLLLLLVASVFFLGQCMMPGTGTIHVGNSLSGGKMITSLYIYPEGSPDTHNELLADMPPYGVHHETGLKPGTYVVHAVVDHGLKQGEESVAVKEGWETVMAFFDHMLY